MKKLFRNRLALLMAVLIILSAFSALSANAESGVHIDEQSFPDAVFREVVLDYYDSDGNEFLSDAEVGAVKDMPLVAFADGDIATLKGIENFTALISLYAGDLGIEEADLSALVNLKTLRINGNMLNSLDVSRNTALTSLICRGNSSLTSLTLNSALQELQCDECALPSLDVTPCHNLKFLNCYRNRLTKLDLSMNAMLENLNCSGNCLPSIDLSTNTMLAGKITSYNIGSQVCTASAFFADKTIHLPFTVDDFSRITSTNIPNPNGAEEEEDVYTGYDNNTKTFKFTDYDIVGKGIDYTYNVNNISSSADMDVHINIEKDFYRVDFINSYDSSVVDYSYVNSGSLCRIPSFPSAPFSGACPHWSDSAENVTQDKEILLLWNDSHSYYMRNFMGGTANISCSVCAQSYSAKFIDHINAKEGTEGYDSVLDADHNGIVNTRDYTILYRK